MVKSTRLIGATNLILFIAGTVNLFAGTRAVFLRDTALAGTALTAALVLLLAATIDRFESLKGLGIEAKTKKLDQKIEQAEETLERLREVAELSGAALITLNSKVGRFDGAPSPEESYKLAQKIRRILVSLGFSNKEMLRSLEPWLKVFFMDLARAITHPINVTLSNRANDLQQKQRANHLNLTVAEQEELNQIRAYQKELSNRIGHLNYSDYPDELLRLINDAPLAEEHTKQQVMAKANGFAQDFLTLREHFCLANPQPWFREINNDRNIH